MCVFLQTKRPIDDRFGAFIDQPHLHVLLAKVYRNASQNSVLKRTVKNREYIEHEGVRQCIRV